MSAKINEGIELVNEGLKYINKKTFFGSAKPDWESAAQSFEKAALCFRNVKDYDRAADAYQRAAESHQQNSSVFMAAKAMENAASISLQNLNQNQAAADYYKRTSQLFLMHGSADRAGECLEKAARALEFIDPQAAGEAYGEACDTYEQEDRTRTGLETFRKTVIFFVRSNQLCKAIAASERLAQIYLKHENKHLFYKQALSTIVLCLAYGDEVDAAKRMDQYAAIPGIMNTDEGRTAGDMIQHYESRDDESFEETKKRNCIRFLDNEIGKLALSVRVPGGASEKVAQQESYSADVTNLKDEIEEEGFC